jgi:elongation factor G
VELEVAPLPGRRGVEVHDGLKAGAIPQAYLPAILDSIRNAAEGGGLFGYPVTGITVTLRSAVFDDVGQPEIALNSATSLAFREALRAASAVVLEPYGRLEIRVPEDYLGSVVKTLHQRRAVVEETGFHKTAVLVRGVVPIGEMFGYLTVLRSHTQGRGSFSLEPLDYRPVPDNLVALHHERLYS